ncbi:MAG TPA: hypothetical protein VMT51_01305, partial [Dongiaceae bacterium]|nr:hypothetical protein [Dongiaceae bacterium]
VKRIEAGENASTGDVGNGGGGAAAVFDAPVAIGEFRGALHDLNGDFVFVEDGAKFRFVPGSFAGGGFFEQIGRFLIGGRVLHFCEGQPVAEGGIARLRREIRHGHPVNAANQQTKHDKDRSEFLCHGEKLLQGLFLGQRSQCAALFLKVGKRSAGIRIENGVELPRIALRKASERGKRQFRSRLNGLGLQNPGIFSCGQFCLARVTGREPERSASGEDDHCGGEEASPPHDVRSGQGQRTWLARLEFVKKGFELFVVFFHG